MMKVENGTTYTPQSTDFTPINNLPRRSSTDIPIQPDPAGNGAPALTGSSTGGGIAILVGIIIIILLLILVYYYAKNSGSF